MTEATTNPFEQFMARYAARPDLFVREVFGAEPDPWQDELLLAVANGERRVSVRSGHGVGKTTALAWLIIWWQLLKFPQKTVCTAPTSDQLFDALAAEVKAWITQLPAQVQELLEVQSEQIFLKAAPSKSFVSFRTSRPEKPEAMAGVHSDNVLLICDEASGIPEAVYEAGAGSMSGHNAVTVLAGNPVRSTGLFYQTHTVLRDLWHTIHVNCMDCKRVAKDFVDDMRRRYGEHSNAFRVRVLGEFPLADDDTVIPRALVEAALDRRVEAHLVQEIWGVDCARFGSDKSALARRKGNVLVKPVEEKGGFDTMQVVGWVKSEYDKLQINARPSDIFVDVIGIGAGVADRLRELGLPVRDINVSEAPTIFDERYANLRAELWFKGKDWLAKKDCHIANDTGLLEELVVPKMEYTSSGKLAVESKDKMKKRGHPSPNKADAFLLTLAGEAVTAIGGGKQSSWKSALKRNIKGLV